MEFKDYFQIAVWIVAIGGGIITAYKAIIEVGRNRKQREIELRWKQALLAKEILDEIENDRLMQNAKNLIDLSDRYEDKYEVREGQLVTITQDEVHNSLKKSVIAPNSLDERENFIVECLETLFMKFERIEHLIAINLIEFEDICDPLYWWIRKLDLNRSGYEEFFQTYEYGQAINFLNRFSKKFNLERWNYKSRIGQN